MDRSFFLKKRRADFVAGSLSGRVIVAGGLGKDAASRVVLWFWCSLGPWHSAQSGEGSGSLYTACLLLYSKEVKTFPSSQPGLHIAT